MLTGFIALISGLFQVVALNDAEALITWQVLSLSLITPLSLLRHTTFEGVLRYLATALFAGLIMQVLGLITGSFMNGAATLLGIMTVLGLVLAGLIRRSTRAGTSDPREAERELIDTLLRQRLLPEADRQELQALHASLQRQFEARQSDVRRSEARQSDIKHPEISDRAKNSLIARSCTNAHTAIKIEQNEGPWASTQFERAVIRWRREPTASAWSGAKASNQARKIRPAPLTPASPGSAESTNPAPRAIHAAQLRRMALISELAPTTALDVIPEQAPLARPRKA